jgi:imidazole glycerol-phosphate synthase subunit HisH
MSDVWVVTTGTANTASVLAGLRRVGAAPRLGCDASAIRDAERLVLPGVGAFGAAITRLRGQGLLEPLRERVRAGRPTLAVCLGLQLLADGSEESPEARGLGLFAETVTRFPASVSAPQMGWNRVAAEPGCTFLKDGYAYFANTYRLQAVPAGWAGARASHGGPFVAGLERGGVLACQFHPELSGGWGLELLARWVELAPARAEEAKCSPCA